MSKVLTSPVKRFPGTVTIADPLSYAQLEAWMHGVNAVQRVKGTDEDTSLHTEKTMWKAIWPCVEKWDLKGLQPLNVEEIPSTPRTAVIRVLSWLSDAVNHVLEDDEAEAGDPNA
jgi:hypothetical protein